MGRSIRYRVAKYAGKTAADGGYLSGLGCAPSTAGIVVACALLGVALAQSCGPGPVGSWLQDMDAGASREQCLDPAWEANAENYQRFQKCQVRAYMACTPVGTHDVDHDCVRTWFQGYPRPAY